MSKHIYIPTQSADDWKQLLARPEKHWRSGFSARALASCWEEADGFPKEVKRIFDQSDIPALQNLQLLLAIPELKVFLPPRGGPSQNDLFVLAKASDDSLISIAVEGKVSEPFGETLADWDASSSIGKQKRLSFLTELLGLDNIPGTIRYQLLHRSASAILEAKKFNAKHAVMLVHSFSQEMLWFGDFQFFASLFNVDAQPGHLYLACQLDGVDFYLAWVKGSSEFLAA
jgi:hypothetical protein